MLKSIIFYTSLTFPIMINLMMIIIILIPSKITKLHPMMLMMILIFLTILLSIKMNFMYYCWIPFLLFLMMIGGLMIIYMYITSLSNNELFYLNLKSMKFYFVKIMIFSSIMILFFHNKNLLNIQDMWFNMHNMMFDQLNISILYKKFNKITYFIMWYLYYTMICIMYICLKSKLPLRQLFY